MCVLFLFPATSYQIYVKTGDVRGAGTDANVFLQLYGRHGDTGKQQLRRSHNTKNMFERARTDQFTIEAADIGQVGSAHCVVSTSGDSPSSRAKETSLCQQFYE